MRLLFAGSGDSTIGHLRQALSTRLQACCVCRRSKMARVVAFDKLKWFSI